VSTTLSATEMAARHHRRAVRFFWAWLLGATLTSLAGNVTHALLNAPQGSRWLAAAVAMVAPTVLLAAVHGIAVLAKVNASGAVYRASVAATGALAVGAFLLSFVALRDLAVMAGIRPSLAPVLPLVIDLAVAVATIALVAVGDKPARRIRSATPTAPPPALGAATPSRSSATSNRAASAPANGVSAGPTATTRAGNDATTQLAADLVSAKVTRQAVGTVEAMLVAHNNGDPLNRIAADLGVHHSAVKRVLNAAEANSQRHLLAAS
jgi:Protein of unknown function (DUF2637)